MQQLPIQATPNQSLSVVLDDNQWDFVIKSTNGAISVSLALNTAQVLSNIRAVAGAFVIPSEYEEAGNFIFVTQSQQIPDYTLFGTTQYLIYLSPDDLAAARAPNPLPITAADFNPIAALPLRFIPRGY